MDTKELNNELYGFDYVVVKTTFKRDSTDVQESSELKSFDNIEETFDYCKICAETESTKIIGSQLSANDFGYDIILNQNKIVVSYSIKELKRETV